MTKIIGAPPNEWQLLTPVEVIEFSLTIDDHFEMRAFLEGWVEGDVSEWVDDIKEWVRKRQELKEIG